MYVPSPTCTYLRFTLTMYIRFYQLKFRGVPALANIWIIIIVLHVKVLDEL